MCSELYLFTGICNIAMFLIESTLVELSDQAYHRSASSLSANQHSLQGEVNSTFDICTLNTVA